MRAPSVALSIISEVGIRACSDPLPLCKSNPPYRTCEPLLGLAAKSTPSPNSRKQGSTLLLASPPSLFSSPRLASPRRGSGGSANPTCQNRPRKTSPIFEKSMPTTNQAPAENSTHFPPRPPRRRCRQAKSNHKMHGPKSKQTRKHCLRLGVAEERTSRAVIYSPPLSKLPLQSPVATNNSHMVDVPEAQCLPTKDAPWGATTDRRTNTQVRGPNTPVFLLKIPPRNQGWKTSPH